MGLEAYRKKIDTIDAQLVALLNERFELVQQIGALKRRLTLQAFDPQRESKLLKRLCELNQGPMKPETLRAVYREILSGSLALEQSMGVAFFGTIGTFTHQAAMAKFGSSVRYFPQATIADVFDAVTRGTVTYGVVPVENSTEGAVTHTLDTFADTSVKICAEINMVIHHNLLSRAPRQQLKVIYSHPQVFGQCRRWLQRNLPDVPQVEVASTAEAAARCAAEPAAGALASQVAAEQHNLLTLEENIEDCTENITRFLVLGNQDPKPSGDDKTSMLFVVRDRVGALYDSLKPFSSCRINLTFIESRPSRRRNWEYCFFVDFLGHVSDPNVLSALNELEEHCQFVKILGSYPKAPSVVA